MNNNKNGLMKNSLFYIVIFLGIMGALYYFVGNRGGAQSQQIQSSQFITELKKNNVKDFTMQPAGSTYRITGTYKKPANVEKTGGLTGIAGTSTKVSTFTTNVLTNDTLVKQIESYATKNKVKYGAKEEESSSIWVQLLIYVLPLVFFIFFFYMMMGQAGQGGGNGRGVMNFGKSKAKPVEKKNNKVRFSDVAGAEEEKQELVEVVEFLRDPRKFLSLGARIPSGVLLEGPPGTGKTLLAKAVAGEAGVPFFSISGSDFVEMFVGVGASRVRDLFENAKKSAPAIIFIDEIDAVGRRRGNGMGGGHDEREQTLNQLLVEMDGFTGNIGIIVMAATNRPDVLDPALLRPGRFDRQITISNPDVNGRTAILKVHARNKHLDSNINLNDIAQRIPGFSGADIENLLNEAALLAARNNRKVITTPDIDEAIDRVMMGPAKKSKKYTEHEKKLVAFHEAGHAVIGLKLKNASVVQKVTIIPRGQAGGYNLMMPKEETYFSTKTELTESIVGFLGGRVAEELIFSDVSTGAHNDFQQATRIARAMVTEYGMSSLGPVQYEQPSGNVFLGRDYLKEKNFSDQVALEIDKEVRKIVEECYEKAKEVISANKELLYNIADYLIKVETLTKSDIEEIEATGKLKRYDEMVAEREAFEKFKAEQKAKEEAERKALAEHVEEKPQETPSSTDESCD